MEGKKSKTFCCFCCLPGSPLYPQGWPPLENLGELKISNFINSAFEKTLIQILWFCGGIHRKTRFKTLYDKWSWKLWKRCVTLNSDLATLLPWRFHSWCRIQAFGDPEQNEFPPALTSSSSINASPQTKECLKPKKDNLAPSYNHRGIYPWNRENLWNLSVNNISDFFVRSMK